MATDTKHDDQTTTAHDIDLDRNAPDSNAAANATQPVASPRKHPAADTRRTMWYVAGAAVCLAITGVIEWSSRPAAIREFGRIGQEFYADFDDPTLATSLEVYVFDTDKVQPRDFRVQRLDNGRWVIPSHHNYPADGEDQLARTASSIIGITRGAMVTRWEADHAHYGVVNPRQDTLSVGDVEGIGKRIILRGEGDTVLADYIVGKKVAGETDQYYVRHPEEEEVYIARLDIDLSTKFTDWIETDLLDVDSWDLTELTINDYSFDETQGPIRLAERQVSRLHRATSSEDWKMDGLDEESEQVDKDAVRETINTIADLKIAGVRPKQQGLTPQLKLDRQLLKSQRDVDRLQTDLLTSGFLLQPGEDGDQEQLRLIAREGELYAATNKGLVYRLHFGRAFTGSQAELETGFSSHDEQQQLSGDQPDESGKQKTTDAPTSGVQAGETDGKDTEPATVAESEDGGKGDADASTKPGRYVFVRVEFDRKYLGDEPVKPTEPEKPEELEEPTGPEQADEAATSAADERNPSSSQTAAEESHAEAGQDGPAGDASVKDDPADDEPAKDDPRAEIRGKYEAAKKKFEDDLREYQTKKEEFDKQVEEGQQKAEQLNRRFADWYYVIPGDSFDKLRLSRADLVEPKEEASGESDAEADGAGAAAAAN